MAILQEVVQETILQLEIVTGRSEEVSKQVDAANTRLLDLDARVKGQAADLEPRLDTLKKTLADGRGHVSEASDTTAKALRTLDTVVDDGTRKSQQKLDAMIASVTKLTADLEKAEADLKAIRSRLQGNVEKVTQRLEAAMKGLVEGVTGARTFLTDDLVPRVVSHQATVQARQDELKKRLEGQVLPDLKTRVDSLHAAVEATVARVRAHSTSLGDRSRNVIEEAAAALDSTAHKGLAATEAAVTDVEQAIGNAVGHIDQRLQEFLAADKACVDEAEGAGPRMVALSQIPGNLQDVLRRARVIR